ncbi:ABC transporter permease [Neofamilia massiliensis]|uniref:ABC transporter permease n=1 Tax=Neofamilia massiliensis TaxID=1673724 RepID=UPI0006BB8195|nr:ABC transporter permease [Neofamilia massiliensis]
MKDLLRGELRTHTNRRMILLVLVILILATTYNFKIYKDLRAGLFQDQMLKAQANRMDAYQSYLYLDELSIDMTKRLKELKEEGGSEEEIEDLQKDLANIDTEKFLVLNIEPYYGNIEAAFKNGLEDDKADLDKNFKTAIANANTINKMTYKDLIEKEIVPKNTALLYKYNIEDFYKRFVTVKARADLGEGANISPTGLSMLDFQMKEKVPYLLIALVVLLNYNTWSKEFEEGHIKTLNSQPFDKKKIFLARTLISLLKTLIVTLLVFFLPVLIAGIINGSGTDLGHAVNSLALEGLFSLNSSKEIYKYLVAMGTSSYKTYYISLMLVYLMFLIAVINFISILLKSDFGSLVGSIIALSLMLFQGAYNPFSYFKIEELLQGDTGIAFKGSLLILGIFILGLNIASYFLYKNYESD